MAARPVHGQIGIGDDADDGCDAGGGDGRVAAVQLGHTLGVAFYDLNSNELQMAQIFDDSSCNGPMLNQALDVIKRQATPGVIYVPSTATARIIEELRRPLNPSVEVPPGNLPDPLNSTEVNATGGDNSYDVRLEKKALFALPAARAMLQSVRPRVPAQVDMNADAQVAAAGALCGILAKEGVLQISPEDAAFTVSRMSQMNLDGFLMVDPLSAHGLGVFAEELHPSVMGIGKSKEGFSIFGLMDRCQTQMGRRLLRLWLMRPLTDSKGLNERLDMVEFFVDSPSNAGDIRDALPKVKDVPRLLTRLVSLQASPSSTDFQSLQRSLTGLLLLRGAIFAAHAASQQSRAVPKRQSDRTEKHQNRTYSTASSTLHRLGGSICEESIQSCQTLIAEVIDVDEESGSVCVRPGICEELDGMRHTFECLPDLLTQVIQEELSRIPRGLMYGAKHLWSIIYMPQIGYMVRVEGEKLGPVLLGELPDFQLSLDSGACAGQEAAFYYTCDRTRQLDTHYGDLQNVISDLEICILSELIRRLSTHSAALREAAASAAECDCLVSLAELAASARYCRPTLTEDNVITIKNGRHPLAEIALDGAFVPNSTMMGQQEARVHIITGPNVSGKSSYIRQVGLITFMAHVGSFVPAEEAVIGFTHRICYLVTQQDISGAHASSFMSDLNQVSWMLQNATPKSLLLLDEFGRGTNSVDGVALLCSVVRSFATRKPGPPRVLASTHFAREVADERCIPRVPSIVHWTMDVIKSSSTTSLVHDDKNDTHKTTPSSSFEVPQVFLYRLVPGSMANSFGVYCAQLAGMPQDVLHRSIEVLRHQQASTPLQPAQSQELKALLARSREAIGALASLDLSNNEACAAFLQGLLTNSVEQAEPGTAALKRQHIPPP